MEGLNNLNALPQDKKDAIIEKFGSISQLYQDIFETTDKKYKLETNSIKPYNYKEKHEEIENILYDIEEQLEEIGIDGHDVITDVSNDHGDIIILKLKEDMDKYLKPLGTDFETMRKWIKENYGI